MIETDTKMQPLSGGGWFDLEAAREFVQDLGLKGKAEPERLYFTKKANWVLYSQQAGLVGDYGFAPVTEGSASHWLLTMMNWSKDAGALGHDIKALFASTEV